MLLVEAGDRVLAAFPPKLSKRAAQSLVNLGVTPLLDHMVTGIDADGVDDARDERRAERPRRTIIWAAGVLAASVSARAGRGRQAPRPTSVGRLLVEPDLSLPGHPEVLAIGDMVQVRGARPAARRRAGGDADGPLRGQARPRPAAREGRRAVQVQGQGQPGDDRPGARGGRAAAAASALCGFPAWALWLGIHLFYLVGFQNRLLVFIRWGFSFLTHGRGTRLITGEQNMP